MTFEFNQQLMPQNLIDIDNIGEFAVEGSNDEGLFWYLIIRTTLGVATIARCGPVMPDVELLPDGYSCSLVRMEYKEKQINGLINKWLNDFSKKLTNAQLIDIDDALDQFKDVGEYMRNYSKEHN